MFHYSRFKAVWAMCFALVLVSCGGGGGGDGSGTASISTSTPVATLALPATGAVFNHNPTLIEGSVEPPDASVTVNGVTATVVNGHFSVTVTLPAGTHPVEVVATSPAGSSTTTFAATLNPNETCGTGATFTVSLPGLSLPDDPATIGRTDRALPDDSVTLPDGCDVYAILVHGYGRNEVFDELMFYKLAKWVAEHNGYVHWSWWNNFVGEYMERPLHVISGTSRGDPRYPYPGNINEFENKLDFFARGGKGKAVPDDDYQFQSDVKRVLTQIRARNPDAIVIVAGHSMGGNAVIRLGRQTTVPIDLLAPIDPVGNRNLPEGQGSSVFYAKETQSAVPGTSHYVNGNETFNWTRWRATRDFAGWTNRDCVRNFPLGPCRDFDLHPQKIDIHCRTVATGLDHRPPSDGLVADLYCPDQYPFSVVRLPHSGPSSLPPLAARGVLPVRLGSKQPATQLHHGAVTQRTAVRCRLSQLPACCG